MDAMTNVICGIGLLSLSIAVLLLWSITRNQQRQLFYLASVIDEQVRNG